MIKLTDHQTETLMDAVDILRKGNRLVLKGKAGTGKTTLANELIKTLKEMGVVRRGVQVTAPTGTAVGVITKKTTYPNVKFSTLHSALKLKMHTDKKTGEKYFKPSYSAKYPPLKGVGLLVIDEGSMVSEKVLEYMEEFASDYNVKVIIIGDEGQIPPVGEDKSMAFHSGYPEVELKEIIRQGEGNPIIDLSRDPYLATTGITAITSERKGYTFTTGEDAFLNKLAAANGTNELKYLAWTNNEVDRINTLVRRKIYGPQVKLIEHGEMLMFDSPYGNGEFVTSETIRVEELQAINVKLKIRVALDPITQIPEIMEESLNIFQINPSAYKDPFGMTNGILVLDKSSDKTFRKISQKMYKNCLLGKCQWVERNKFIDRFAKMKYCHAMTVHKSQGQTFTKAVVNVGNIRMNSNTEECAKMFYTAVTRVSDLLILHNYA